MWLGLAAAAVAGLCGILGLAVLLGPAPRAEPPPLNGQSITFVTADGEPFAQRGPLRSAPVDARALPAYVTQAFVAIEDRRFYRHHGLDWKGIARAAVVDVTGQGALQGGSTITQQLIKNTELGPQRTLVRKAREAIGALRLEHRLGKQDILSRYMSTIYFGDGAYGLGAAAQLYFAKAPEDVSLGEAAMLAGLVKAPTQLSPLRHYALAVAREDLVLRAMVREGYITASDAHRAGAANPVSRPPPNAMGGYFADWLYPTVSKAVGAGYGSVEVRTSLDGALQHQAEAIVEQALQTYGRSGGVSQAALVAMRPDGRVVAMVGGRDHDVSPFNRAVQARRQPGSTFKLFVYLAALRQGASPDQLVSDAPIRIGNWSPSNADRTSHGPLSLEDAFATSNNLAAIRVSQAVGIPAVIRAARDLGVTSPLEAVPSLALGSSGVSLLELTSAYAAVARGAYPARPSGLGTADASPSTPMDPTARQGLLRLLRAAASHAGPAATLPIPVFGKTGTSQNFRDALFVGFAGDLIVGVWVGNDDEQPMTQVYGSTLPAKIWGDFVRSALAGRLQPGQDDAEVEPDFGPADREPVPDTGLWSGIRDVQGA